MEACLHVAGRATSCCHVSARKTTTPEHWNHVSREPWAKLASSGNRDDHTYAHSCVSAQSCSGFHNMVHAVEAPSRRKVRHLYEGSMCKPRNE